MDSHLVMIRLLTMEPRHPFSYEPTARPKIAPNPEVLEHIMKQSELCDLV